MIKSGRVPANLEEIQKFNNRARGHYLSSNKNGETRHLEAFLLQATLLEGVLTRLGLELLKKRNLTALAGKRNKRYGIDNAINDLYLLGEITSQEFNALEKFKTKRNEYIHDFLSKNAANMEYDTKELYDVNRPLVEVSISKLEKVLKQ